MAATRTERAAERVAGLLAGARSFTGLVKSNMASRLPTGTSTTTPNTQPANANIDGLYQAGGMPGVPMPRMPQVFGSQLGPGQPLLPAPLDPVNPQTGRAGPRAWQAPVSWNLDLTTRRTPWQVLKALADQCDVVHRCIEIRVAEIIGLDWDFTLSDHAVSQIMSDDNVGHAQASKLGREQFGPEIDRLKSFFEAPMPGYTFSDWMVELLWNHYVYDAVAIWPECTLGGKVVGLMIVDGSTIKPLLDNRGLRPRPPAPAFQQILWGFPRGEYQESDPNSVDGEFAAVGAGRISDQLAYFVQNKRTWDPYGFSTVEECIPAATLYLGRQRWLQAEYSEGAMPTSWMKSDGEFTPTQLGDYERVLNDMLSGNTSERKRIKLLNKGFEPVAMPQTDERYKPEYDETLIKQIGSKFGVMPTQLGVIPRTGLAGRGQQQGEQDQAETVSGKPTEEWVVDVINQLTRRFLGATREITFVLNGGESSSTAQVEALTDQIKSSSAQWTINDVRGKNGDPLFDIPEADTPFLMTPTGPVFLPGLLDKQLNPPTPPPSPFGHPAALPPGRGAGGADTADEDPNTPDVDPADPEASDTQKAAEVKAYRRWAAKERAREFEWRYHTLDEAKHVVADVRKAADPKGDARPGPGGHREKTIADHWVPKLRRALKLGVDPAKVAADWIKLHGDITKEADPQRVAAEAEAKAWAAQMALDTGALRQLIQALHADGYVSGAQTATDQLVENGGAVVTSDLTDATTGIDWDNWTPGDPATAALVDDGGLAELLAKADITINGLTTTTLDRLTTALADNLQQGGTVQQLAAVVSGIVDDPDRAATIATTETNRAMTAGQMTVFRTNGIQGFDWLSSASACYLCQAETEDNPHGMGDDTPPGHPNCRCAISPVLIMPDGSEQDD